VVRVGETLGHLVLVGHVLEASTRLDTPRIDSGSGAPGFSPSSGPACHLCHPSCPRRSSPDDPRRRSRSPRRRARGRSRGPLRPRGARATRPGCAPARAGTSRASSRAFTSSMRREREHANRGTLVLDPFWTRSGPVLDPF
jgi:hypothetical protein